METLIQKTENYIHYFNAKNLSKIIDLFNDKSVLYDPDNRYGIFDKKNILTLFENLFSNEIFLNKENIYVDEDKKTSIIEFSLKVNEHNIVGTDIIEWSEDHKIISLRAYLYNK